MCEFISWVKEGQRVYFLTKTQCDSPQGLALKERFPGEGELLGHGAIRAYYDIVGGKDVECTDFSTPNNFPAEIVRAIKNGEFRGFGTPGGLLNQQAFQHIPELVKADAAYHKADDDWDKQADAAWGKARADWYKANALWQMANAEWHKAVEPYFWDLFAEPNNRTEAWK